MFSRKLSVITAEFLIFAILPACASNSQSSGNFSMMSGGATEEWTILCKEFVGSDHRRYCEEYAETLRRTPEIRTDEVECRHDDSQAVSRLYYGRYRRRVNSRTGERSRPPELIADLQLIQDLGDPVHGRHFVQARMTLVPQEKLGPEAYKLSNAPGLYSLQIAVFYPEPGYSNYRQDAVKLVQQLRREGYEAYYYHGEVQSMVTVGSFGPEAVIVTPEGQYQDSAEVGALRRRDPRFEYNYENHRVRAKIIDQQRFPSHSFLVRIPGKSAD